jgi:hypothetical protein
MGEATPVDVTVYIGLEGDAPPEEVDALARGLLREVRELEVEAAELATAGAAPAGAKSGDAITLGAVALAVLPAFLPKIMDFIQAWALRGHGRVVRFKGKVAGQEIEFEGTAADLKAVLAALGPAQPDEATARPRLDATP